MLLQHLYVGKVKINYSYCVNAYTTALSIIQNVKRIKLMYAGQLMHRVNDSITCILW